MIREEVVFQQHPLFSTTCLTNMSATKKLKSLRDSLKELENPAFDITFNEQEEDDITAAKVISNDVESSETEEENSKNFGNLRKKAFVNQEEFDSKYFGNLTTRKSLTDWNEKESPESVEQAATDESDDEEYLSTESDEAENEEVESGCDENEEGSEIEEENMSDDNESLGSDEDGINNTSDNNAMEIDFSKLPDDLKKNVSNVENVKLKKVEDNEDDDEISHFTESKMEKEIQKGKATKAQIELLDKLLETRIRLQKSLILTNRFPQSDVLSDFKDKANTQVVKDLNGVKSSMKDFLKNLLELQEYLLINNEETKSLLSGNNEIKKDKNKFDEDEEIASDTEDENESESEKEEEKEIEDKLNLPSKRKHTLTVNDFEEEISKRHSVYLPYQENIINKWYDKTRLVSSKINNKGFSGFEKSTVQQIKQVLTDRPRLIKRTQLRRTPYSILGKRIIVTEEDDKEQIEDSHLKDFDENIFDDGDFYHEMLKELIERKSNVNTNDPIAAGRQYLELQKLRTKIKRKIDTRASKGRKVRYDVHSKLVSFMAPRNAGSMSDQGRNDLYSSLFGGLSSQPIR